MSDVQYWVNHVRSCSCLASDMEEKQIEMETENNTADNAGITQSQARDTRYH